MRRRFITADVFTDRPFAGNPLAVVLDAQELDTGQMQKIAREFNLSETVFVLPPDAPGQTRRVRIFTPGREIPFAGHPTIGTALVLAAIGELDLAGDRVEIVLGEGAGPVPVSIEIRNGRPVSAMLTSPTAPEVRAAPERRVLADLLTLQPEDVVRGAAASCGNPFLLVEVKGRQALKAARYEQAAARRHLEGAWAAEPFVFTTEGCDPGYDLHARMFAPAHGIPEDPATGSAAAAFGGWLGLTETTAEGILRRVIAQGVEMGRPSRLEVEVEKRGGAVTAVRVAGCAVLISEGMIETPPAG